ncbi:LysR family transcriptional regulator [Roseomonas elaeocarpi]|uniref:LysR family transcriptional regulator n=1 Tax=Roseomonas elaeocarpi TaxID=907779 RepID=A0ABV6JPW2_9PROT
MNKFQAMLIFTTVAERGGFTVAANKLDMSPSAVTKNVAALECELGVQLFNRTTRSIALTDIGQEFYERCSEILAALDTAEEAMRDRNAVPKGRVRVIMPYSFGRVTFVPELPEFRRRFPAIDLDVHFSDGPVDLIREGFDLAVLARDLDDSRLIRRILHRGPEVTVAAPRYLEEHGVPHTPLDLIEHDCIIGNFGDEWKFRTADGGDTVVQVRGAVTLHNGDAVLEAAVAGLGVAQSTWWLFRKELERGRLVPVLADYQRPGLPVSVLYPAKRYLPKKTTSLIQFLSEITRTRSEQDTPLPVLAAGA